MQKTQMNSSYSCRTGMETLGVAGNQVLVMLRKVTATTQLKVNHQAQNTVKHTEIKQRRAWTKEEIREVLYVLQTEFYRKLQESV